MSRLNLYLSDDLKARMDAVGESVNWSRIAATAFEGKLAEIAAGKERMQMEEIVQRLRASKLKDQDRTTSEAREAGMKWGAEEAEWDRLEQLEHVLGNWKATDWEDWNPENLVRYRDYARGALPWWGPARTGPIYVHVLRVLGEVVPPQNPENKDVEQCLWSDSLDWWGNHGAGAEPSTEFVRDFVVGALDVFEKVRAQMEGGK